MRLFLSLLICVPCGLVMGAGLGSPAAPVTSLIMGGLVGLVMGLGIGGFKPIMDILYPPGDDPPSED